MTIVEKNQNTVFEEIQGTLEEIIGQIKRLIREGNARRVIVQGKNGRILFQSQLTMSAAGAAFFVFYAPVLSAIATIVLLANEVKVIVEKDDIPEEELKDEYEVDAEVIEIRDEDQNEEKSPPEES
ncbi:MAG: DUF4342 domain-containing protein [Balneolaceae bacterium]|nr:MAG: DUF4342 domain-containing protein [Balneolaceae bacterium]